MIINGRWIKWMSDSRLGTAVLLLAVAVTFWPSLSLPILDGWDDNIYIVYQLPLLQPTWVNAYYWLTALVSDAHVPTTMYTYMLDGILWNFSPKGMHLQNMLWHLAATMGMYYCLKRLGINGGLALLGTLFWTVQPQRVESVAWLTERKDVVFGACYLWSIWFYLRNERFGWHYWLALALFIIGCGAKSMCISMPFVLLMYEFSRTRSWNPWFYVKRLWPFLIAAGLLLLWFGTEQRFHESYVIPWSVRVDTVLFNFWFYPVKTFFPFNLNPIYGKVIFTPSLWLLMTLGYGVILGAGVFWWRYNRKFCLYVFLPFLAAYVLMLLPVAGFVPLASLDRADRFSYILSPLLIFGLIAYLSSCKNNRFGSWLYARYGVVITILLFAVCAWNSYRSIQMHPMWQNIKAIYTTAANTYPTNPMVLFITGILNVETGKHPEVEKYIEQLHRSPYLREKCYNPQRIIFFGDCLRAFLTYRQGKQLQALPQLENISRKLESDQWLKTSYYGLSLMNLADCYHAAGKNPEAVKTYNKLRQLYPTGSVEDFYFDGLANYVDGNLPATAEAMQKCLHLEPQNPNALKVLNHVETIMKKETMTQKNKWNKADGSHK